VLQREDQLGESGDDCSDCDVNDVAPTQSDASDDGKSDIQWLLHSMVHAGQDKGHAANQNEGLCASRPVPGEMGYCTVDNWDSGELAANEAACEEALSRVFAAADEIKTAIDVRALVCHRCAKCENCLCASAGDTLSVLKRNDLPVA
jgi:hypothetical protein